MKYASLMHRTCRAGRALWRHGAGGIPTEAVGDPRSADRLFEAGKFAEAGDVYARIIAQDPEDYAATLR